MSLLESVEGLAMKSYDMLLRRSSIVFAEKATTIKWETSRYCIQVMEDPAQLVGWRRRPHLYERDIKIKSALIFFKMHLRHQRSKSHFLSALIHANFR